MKAAVQTMEELRDVQERVIQETAGFFFGPHRIDVQRKLDNETRDIDVWDIHAIQEARERIEERFRGAERL